MGKKSINIGLVGLIPNSPNKGCEALTFSFCEFLASIFKNKNVVLYFFEYFSFKFIFPFYCQRYKKTLFKNYLNVKFKKRICFFLLRKRKAIVLRKKKEIDFCVDFTFGDSFSDIYGQERFDQWSSLKLALINKRIPLVLGSQTYGPFKIETNKIIVKKILDGSFSVFARDAKSLNYLKDEFDINAILTTDIAFFLPYDSNGEKLDKSIGFNPSGLLWNDAKNNSNQFGLTINYIDFCKNVVSTLINKGFNVHLIGHVVSEDLSLPDNDWCAIKELNSLFPQTVVAPFFDTPIEAKSYISRMMFFIGARMHATIAAISSATPVLPFSYSRKFEGLFDTLHYSYVIHGCEDTLEDAEQKVYSCISNIDLVNGEVKNALNVIDNMKEKMIKDYTDCFLSILNKKN